MMRLIRCDEDTSMHAGAGETWLILKLAPWQSGSGIPLSTDLALHPCCFSRRFCRLACRYRCPGPPALFFSRHQSPRKSLYSPQTAFAASEVPTTDVAQQRSLDGDCFRRFLQYLVPSPESTRHAKVLSSQYALVLECRYDRKHPIWDTAHYVNGRAICKRTRKIGEFIRHAW